MKVRINRGSGVMRKGTLLNAVLKNHGVVATGSDGVPRLLQDGSYTIEELQKGKRITLRHARYLTGLNHINLAKNINRSERMLLAYETGEYNVPDKIRDIYAEQLGLKKEWIEWSKAVNKQWCKEHTKMNKKMAAASNKNKVDAVKEELTQDVIANVGSRLYHAEKDIAVIGDRTYEMNKKINHHVEDLSNQLVDLRFEVAGIFDITENQKNKLQELDLMKNMKLWQRMKWLFTGKIS